jgi:hypothetical protein
MADPLKVKFVVIVCGTQHPDGIEFNKMADAHVRDLVAFYASKVDDKATLAPLGTPVRYLHFDPTLGVVCVAEQVVKRSKTPKYEWKLLAAFTSALGTPAEDPKTFVTLPSNARALRFATTKPPAADPDFGKTGHEKHIFKTTKLDDQGNTVDRDVSGVLSITDVYRSIRGAPPKSVIELVFFTHGFTGGPVLVNSFDDNGTATLRTTTDKDGRADKDFLDDMGEPPVAGATLTALALFKRAFDPGAIVRTCGCDVQDANSFRSTSFQIIREAWVLKIRSGASDKALRKKLMAKLGDAGAIGPTDDVPLDMEAEFRLEHDADKTSSVDEIRTAHLAVETPLEFFTGYDKDKPFTKQWGDILKFIAKQNLATYSVKLGQAVGVTVFAAPHGTSSENEQGASHNTMRVCRSGFEPGCFSMVTDPVTKVSKPRPHEAYGPFLEFYEKFFKLSRTDLDKISGTHKDFYAFDKAAIDNLTFVRDNGKLP